LRFSGTKAGIPVLLRISDFSGTKAGIRERFFNFDLLVARKRGWAEAFSILIFLWYENGDVGVKLNQKFVKKTGFERLK
jgi:hypothetical protein